jgi:hypothetical protein
MSATAAHLLRKILQRLLPLALLAFTPQASAFFCFSFGGGGHHGLGHGLPPPPPWLMPPPPPPVAVEPVSDEAAAAAPPRAETMDYQGWHFRPMRRSGPKPVAGSAPSAAAVATSPR